MSLCFGAFLEKGLKREKKLASNEIELLNTKMAIDVDEKRFCHSNSKASFINYVSRDRKARITSKHQRGLSCGNI